MIAPNEFDAPRVVPRPIDHQCRVLVPYDLSERSRPALHAALQLAERWQAAITVLHVSEPEFVADGLASGMDAIDLLHRVLHSKAGPLGPAGESHRQRTRLVELRRMRHSLPADLRHSPSVSLAWTSGDVVDEIVRYAAEGAVDAIILTQPAPTRWRLDTATRRVIRLAPCQVMIAYPSGVSARASA